jgi:hypothetical protein
MSKLAVLRSHYHGTNGPDYATVFVCREYSLTRARYGAEESLREIGLPEFSLFAGFAGN